MVEMIGKEMIGKVAMIRDGERSSVVFFNLYMNIRCHYFMGERTGVLSVGDMWSCWSWRCVRR